MRQKNYLIIWVACVCMCISATAQISIPNGGFENWTSSTYGYPQNYTQTSNPEAFFKFNTAFNLTQSTDAYHGNYAVQLTTTASVTDTSPAYFINASSANGNPATWPGGIPYNQQATGIRGYYKYNVASADSGTLIVNFKYAGTSIGLYFFQIGGVHTSYTLFDFTFNPALPIAPDTIVFAVASTSIPHFNGGAYVGAELKIDSVSFTGVASQPSMLNGDFEQWQTQTLDKLTGWFSSGNDGIGVAKTTDHYAGAYALELQTHLGDRNNSAVAESGQAGTGNCNGGMTCNWIGGYPFSHQVDTVQFYYKYAPTVIGDRAQINLTFKKNGVAVFSTGGNYSASATWQLAELPFDVGQAPDTVIIQMNSSSWNDTAVSYIGADFKVDEMYMKSQLPTTVQVIAPDKQLAVYPNPSSDGTFFIDHLSPNDRIHLYNCIGAEVNVLMSYEKTFTILKLPADGIYILQIITDKNSITKKLIVSSQ